MSDTGAPEMHPRKHNGAAVLIGILVAGVVAGVFILKQSGGGTPAPPLTTGSSQPPRLSSSPTSATATPAQAEPPSDSPAPSIAYETPGPLPENVEPPEEYEACVAWYESYGYNADNCPSPDPEMESLMAAASARAAKAAIPLSPPSVSPSTAAQINLQKCRGHFHAIGLDPEDCSKIPDIEYIDADRKFSVSKGCSRDPMDQPGVTECGGDDYEPEVDPDGDGGVDSVEVFAPAGWDIEAEFYGSGDEDSRGLEWGGGDIVVQLTTEARAVGMSITDKYGEHLAPTGDSGPGRTIRATLPAGRYIVHAWTDAKTDRVPYRLTLKAG